MYINVNGLSLYSFKWERENGGNLLPLSGNAPENSL